MKVLTVLNECFTSTTFAATYYVDYATGLEFMHGTDPTGSHLLERTH